MKNIYILVGVVFLIVFIIMVSVFYGDIFDFAKNLGDKTSDINLGQNSKFYGTWETTYIIDDERFIGVNGLYKFNSDKTGLIGGIDCTWEISDEKLLIYYNEGFSILTYDFVFSEDEKTLTLTNDKGSLEFIKK